MQRVLNIAAVLSVLCVYALWLVVAATGWRLGVDYGARMAPFGWVLGFGGGWWLLNRWNR